MSDAPSTQSAPYLFFKFTNPAPSEPALPDGYQVRIWRPGWRSPPPTAIRDPVHWAWWLFHLLHLFTNRDFGVVLIEQEGVLVHRSGVFPRYFRFPFMARADLQIGGTWTKPDQRGRGLAGAAIATALARLHRPGRVFWYIVDDANVASIRVIQRRGFLLAGRGARLPRLGMGALSYYALTAPTRATLEARTAPRASP